MAYEIRTLAWRWDRPKCILWADVVLVSGEKMSVGLPLAHVTATFDACSADVGFNCPPLVGAVDSVDGFFSAIKKAAKGVTKAAKAAVKVTTKVLKKAVAVHVAIVKSKLTTYALSGLAAVVPAVGAPALAAQLAAKKALDMYEQAKAAKSALQNGAKKTPQLVAAVARGGSIMRSVQSLSRISTPQARFAAAALRSLPTRAA